MLKEYMEPLRETTLVRLIKEVHCCGAFLLIVHLLIPASTSSPQVSQVYETIELSRLSELAAFANATNLERVVVNTARSNGIQVWYYVYVQWYI